MIMVGTLVLLGMSPLAAHAVSAPPGEASATTGRGGELLIIGHSQAHAGPDGANSAANPLGLGPPFSVYPFGGSQKGVGKRGGALAGLGTSATGPKARVMPWQATVTDDAGHSHALGDAAILQATTGDLLTIPLSLSVAATRSEADYTGGASSGASSSDGVLFNAGNGVAVDVLHSDASSSGKGSSYLVDFNGTRVLTGDQVNGQCSQSLPGAVSLSCLSATGGPGASQSEVASATLGDASSGPTQGASVSSTGSSGTGNVSSGTGANTGASTGAQPQPQSVSGASSVADLALQRGGSRSSSRASLPFTGASSWFLLMSGVALCALGGTITAIGHRLTPFPWSSIGSRRIP
jgi:hypothetical protein